MHYRSLSRLLIALLFLVVISGCLTPRWLVGGVSFRLGWLMGARSVPIEVETHCYRNGEEIDCSALPVFEP